MTFKTIPKTFQTILLFVAKIMTGVKYGYILSRNEKLNGSIKFSLSKKAFSEKLNFKKKVKMKQPTPTHGHVCVCATNR